MRELISSEKKKNNNTQAGNELSNILPKSSYARKKATTTFKLIQNIAVTHKMYPQAM